MPEDVNPQFWESFGAQLPTGFKFNLTNFGGSVLSHDKDFTAEQLGQKSNLFVSRTTGDDRRATTCM